jgi:hypothetical protein
VADRGYRVVFSDSFANDETERIERLAQADVAITFVDDPSPEGHYARGLIAGASVPTIELATIPSSGRNWPEEFWPVSVSGQARRHEELTAKVDQHLALSEEDFLELPDQTKVERYFRALVSIGPSGGSYSETDHDRVVSVVMGDQYTVGQAGAVGPRSEARDVTFVQTWNQLSGTADTHVLADELGRLRQQLRTEGGAPEQDIAVAALAEAEIQANRGDGPAALERLSRLSGLRESAKWVLGTATAIGTTVAAAALRAALGI